MYDADAKSDVMQCHALAYLASILHMGGIKITFCSYGT